MRPVKALVVLLVFCSSLTGFLVHGAEIPVEERRAFEAARIALEDGLYDFAEKKYSEFVTLYSESSLIPEVRLQLAKSRYYLRKYEQALESLRRYQKQSAALGDQYQFWIAETLLAQGNTEEAADAFSSLPDSYPNSALKLDAAFREALVHFEAGNLDRAIQLLASSDKAFESARVQNPDSESGVGGVLVLAEAQLAQGMADDALNSLKKLPKDGLGEMHEWQRSNIHVRALLAADRPDEAEKLVPGMTDLAQRLGRPTVIAETHSLRAQVLEKLGRAKEAIEAYRPNLEASVSPGWRREALVKTVELALGSGSPDDVVKQLELLSADELDAPARDLVQLTLGELRLKQFYALPFDQRIPGGVYSPAASNALASAQVHFDHVVQQFTNSPYLGKAWMNKAWCDWQMQQWAGSDTGFGRATDLLSEGVDQAVSIFKQGDARFMLKRYPDALTNYNRVISEYGENELIKEQLLDQVYYQIIQSGIAAGDLESAVPAMQALIGQFPGSFYADRSLLLVGQALNDIRDPVGARNVFEGFESRFTGSSLQPEVQLAVARTYELEENWTAAAEEYRKWLEGHGNHSSRPAAMFGSAWAEAQAGNIDRALTGFTNFVARFPTNTLTPTALVWLGDEYFSRGDYENAELRYQQVFVSSNWPISEVTFSAQVMAGRAAFARQDFAEAKRYLTNVVNNPRCPDDVYTSGLFAYGDVLMSEPTEATAKFANARGAFDRLIASRPESSEVPAALGRIGDCNFQLNLFVEATNAYHRCMSHPRVDLVERSQAEVKLGKTLEQMAELDGADQDALRTQAMEHYLNVFYQINVPVESKQVADTYWVQRAGLEAASLSIMEGKHQQAAEIYRTLKEMLPQMSAQLDRRIQQQEALSGEGGG